MKEKRKLVTNVIKKKYIFNVTRANGKREDIAVWAESLSAAFLKLPADVQFEKLPMRVKQSK